MFGALHSGPGVRFTGDQSRCGRCALSAADLGPNWGVPSWKTGKARLRSEAGDLERQGRGSLAQDYVIHAVLRRGNLLGSRGSSVNATGW